MEDGQKGSGMPQNGRHEGAGGTEGQLGARESRHPASPAACSRGAIPAAATFGIICGFA